MVCDCSFYFIKETTRKKKTRTDYYVHFCMRYQHWIKQLEYVLWSFMVTLCFGCLETYVSMSVSRCWKKRLSVSRSQIHTQTRSVQLCTHFVSVDASHSSVLLLSEYKWISKTSFMHTCECVRSMIGTEEGVSDNGRTEQQQQQPEEEEK